MSEESAVRAEFERWAKSVNLKAERWKVDPNRYVSDEAHFSWIAYQAGRQSLAESCPLCKTNWKVADQDGRKRPVGWCLHQWHESAAESKGNAQDWMLDVVAEFCNGQMIAAQPWMLDVLRKHAPAAPERPTIKAIVSDRGNWRLEIDGEAFRAEDARQLVDKLNGAVESQAGERETKS